MANYAGDGFQRFSSVSTGYEFLICILFFFFPLKKRHRPTIVSSLSSKDTILYGNSRDTFFPLFFFPRLKNYSLLSLPLPLNLISRLKISANREWLAIIPKRSYDSYLLLFPRQFQFPSRQRNIPPSFPSYLFFLSKFVTLTPLEQKGRCLLKIFNSANSFESTTNLSFQFLRFRQFLLRDDFITCWVKLRTGNSHAILLNW